MSSDEFPPPRKQIFFWKNPIQSEDKRMVAFLDDTFGDSFSPWQTIEINFSNRNSDEVLLGVFN